MCYGPELISKAFDRWAYEKKVTLDFSRPGNQALGMDCKLQTAPLM